MSKQWRNDGPKHTKILVTNLPDVRARQVVDVYRRGWSVELLIKKLKGVTGLGQHQVTKDPQRVERSVAIAVMAYLRSVKFRAQDIPEQGAWSLITRKCNFAWQLAQGELERGRAAAAKRAVGAQSSIIRPAYLSLSCNIGEGIMKAKRFVNLVVLSLFTPLLIFYNPLATDHAEGGQLRSCNVTAPYSNCSTRGTAYDIGPVAYFDDIPGYYGPGYGVNPYGVYWVFLEWVSDRRFAVKARDGGECDEFCAYVDIDGASCPADGRWMRMDGVRLREDSKTTYWKSGLKAYLAGRPYLGKIEGPYNKANGEDWEWIHKLENNHCFSWTSRKTPIISALYWLYWDGQPIHSNYQTQWIESDPVGNDDHSVKTIMNLGKALTQCLQITPAASSSPLKYPVTGPFSGRGSLYTNVCHESGGCRDPDDYKIETYFNVYCRVMKSSYPNGSPSAEKSNLYDTIADDDSFRYGATRQYLEKIFGY